jgi:hypothetical protein
MKNQAPLSQESANTLDTLNNELKSIMAMLGSDKAGEREKAAGRDRLAELTDQIVGISKRGDAPVYLVNLLDKQWLVQRSYSSFFVRGKEPGDDYAVTEVTGRKAVIDTGRGGEANQRDRGWVVKLDTLYYTAMQIAKDICKEVNGDLPAISGMRGKKDKRVAKTMGVFVSPTRRPSAELLEAERARLNVYFATLVAEGNAAFNKTKDWRLVSDLARDAAEYLGVSTEWHENLLNRQVCPGCGEQVSLNIAKHPACGAILDEDRAYELGMLSPPQAKKYELEHDLKGN